MGRFKPVEFKVLLIPDKVEEKQGRIIIPESVRDKTQISQDKATIVEVGGNAFENWSGQIPKVGDRVLINRHAGYRFLDDSVTPREEYRVVNDRDITLILESSDE